MNNTVEEKYPNKPSVLAAADLYANSAEKASLDGYRAGSHEWWNAIRRYNALSHFMKGHIDNEQLLRALNENPI